LVSGGYRTPPLSTDPQLYRTRPNQFDVRHRRPGRVYATRVLGTHKCARGQRQGDCVAGVLRGQEVPVHVEQERGGRPAASDPHGQIHPHLSGGSRRYGVSDLPFHATLDWGIRAPTCPPPPPAYNVER
jgi:hypothetical protein